MSGQKSSDNDYTEVQNSEESADEANISAAMDDSEIFEKELLRGNEKSLGQLLSDIRQLKAEVGVPLDSDTERQKYICGTEEYTHFEQEAMALTEAVGSSHRGEPHNLRKSRCLKNGT